MTNFFHSLLPSCVQVAAPGLIHCLVTYIKGHKVEKTEFGENYCLILITQAGLATGKEIS